MDTETKQMFELILTKLDGMEKKQDGMDKKLGTIEKKQISMEKKQDSMEKKQDSMEKKQDSMEKKQDSMEKKQDSMESKQESMSMRLDEMYVMQGALEENAKVTRAEQSKMMYILADIQGKVTKLTGEVQQHENFISQIRSIK